MTESGTETAEPTRVGESTSAPPTRQDRAELATRQTLPEPQPYPDSPAANWPLALGATAIGSFLSFLDISIVNVGLATIQNDFGVSVNDIQWVTTAYTLTLGVVVPASGWLGDRFGLTRVYIWSIFAFGVVSVLCGAAWGLSDLVAFRVLQAVPGAIIPTVSLIITHRIVPKDKIGLGIGVNGISAVFGPAIGPTLGGYIIEYLNWRLIFFINVPLCLIAMLLGWLAIPKFSPSNADRLDVRGFTAIAASLFTLLLALSKGSDWGWTGYRILILLTISALSLALFVVVELEVENPLLDPRLFRSWTFTNAQILTAVLSAGFFAVLFYIPLFLQHGQGITPVNTGLVMLSEAVAMLLGAPLGGMIYDRVGPRWPVFIGLIISVYGSCFISHISPGSSRFTITIWIAIRAFGYAVAVIAVMAAGLAAAPPEKADGVNALNQLVFRVSAALALGSLNAVAAVLQAQLMIDRSPVVGGNFENKDPRLLVPIYELLAREVQSRVVSDVFVVITWITLLGAFLALTLPHGCPTLDSADGSLTDPESRDSATRHAQHMM